MDPGASKAVCNPNHPQSHTQTYTLLTSPPAQNHPLGPPCAENQTQVSVSSLPPRPLGSAGLASSPVFTCRSSLQPRSGELHPRPLAHPLPPAPAPDSTLRSAPHRCAPVPGSWARLRPLGALHRLPTASPQGSAPGASRHLWTEHAFGVGVLTATSDPREDLGGLQSLFSCDSHYLKFWKFLFPGPQTLINFAFLFPFWQLFF